MKDHLRQFYQSLAARDAQAALLYATAATILLVSIGGIVSSTTIGLLVGLGLLTILFDRDIRDDLIAPRRLLPVTLLMGGVLIWQALGIVARSPVDVKATSVLGSAVGIAMLLPLLLAAMRRDPGFSTRFLKILVILGSIAAVVSLARYAFVILEDGRVSAAELSRFRLVPIGRASHQILGSGGLAACFFAGLAIYPKAPGRDRRLIVAGMVLMAVTVAFTQSRGPLLGMGLAVGAAGLLSLFRTGRTRVWIGLSLAALCFAVPVLLVLTEPWIKALACASPLSLCRPSNRQDVWSIVSGMIQESPWFGIGPNFRFPGGSVSHPHNGLLGLAFYFGLPMVALFLGIIALAVTRAAAARPGPARTFALLGLFFSMSFVATDLSNPFAFVNTLYLYLWLPVWFGSVLDLAPQEGPAGPTAAGDMPKPPA